ncbi:MAG: glycoside hydrolase family 3 C-terminal domain-containing protein, partial [Bacteroidota bacterium]
MTESNEQALVAAGEADDVAARAAALVREMTLEEKVSQMVHQAVAIEHLGIPEYNWWNECLHGVARAGLATVFPQAIGLAATFDVDLTGRVATAISDEARAKHHDFVRRGVREMYTGLTYWSPNVNIFRDPRWGRGQETYGEDPYLTSRMGVAFVRGLQGDDPRYLKLVATPKHFAVHSGPESQRHSFDAIVSERDLRETYLPAFEACVREGRAGSVMGAYNRTNGEACCASPTLLQRILRDEWGFDGYVVSDCWAIGDIYRHHKLVDRIEQAAALAVRSGCDLNCGEAYLALLLAERQGLISEEEIGRSVERLMAARLRLGMFDPPGRNPYAAIPPSVINSPEHVALAREAAAKSVVLLKNDKVGKDPAGGGRLLPLKKRLKVVAVIGPAADSEEVLLGNYNGTPARPVTVLNALRARLEPRVTVRYGQGCAFAEGWPNLYPLPMQALSTVSGVQPGQVTPGGLHAAYYQNPSFAGGPALERTDNTVDFVWREERPLPYLGTRPFSVRWTGAFVPPVTGRHRLGFRGCGHFTLYLDGRIIIQGDNEHHAMLVVHDLDLEANRRYDLRIDYVSGIHQAHAQLLWATPGQAQVERETALTCAADADVVIACMGLSPALEGEEMPVNAKGFSGGDRTDIRLPQPQQELLELLYGLHKPVVLVLQTGSAIAIPWAAEKISAILVAWYGGEQAGNAIADVLFGDTNPAGRLPVTFYRSMEDLPPFDDYAMSSPKGGRTYRYFQGWPLYPFGHGLSYTHFTYTNLVVSAETLGPGGETTVSVDIVNEGPVAGDEVVQLYVRYPNSAVPRPRQELKGFDRVYLAPGEGRTVRFALPARQLAYWDG